jgi:tetratricopeptide (TPR) repeat protein
MRFLLTTAFVAITTVSFAQSDSATIFLNKGLEEKGKGRLLESYKAFDKAYSYSKTNREVVSNLANTLYDLRRYPQAREKFLELEKMGDNSVDTYNKLMTLSFNLRQYPDAIKYAQLVKKTDASAKTAYYIGKAHYEQENYGDAIKFLNVAAQEDAANAEVPYLMARVLCRYEQP